MPSDRALFFPVVNVFSAGDPGTESTFDEQLGIARSLFGKGSGSAKIDGKPVNKVKQYYVESPEFALELPEDNVFAAPAGTYKPAAAVGIYLLLEPLPAGKHVIQFKGSTKAHVKGSNKTFAVDVTYNLIVS